MSESEHKGGSRILNHFVGWVLYPMGDLIGQLITGEFSITRTIVIMILGGTFYRIEIPYWFHKLETFTIADETVKKHPALEMLTTRVQHNYLNWLGKTLGATAYFNPLWMARHMLFITCATTPLSQIDWGNTLLHCLRTGSISFLTNLPITFGANYFIQAHLPLKRRFLGSALLTMTLTIKYAVEYRIFS